MLKCISGKKIGYQLYIGKEKPSPNFDKIKNRDDAYLPSGGLWTSPFTPQMRFPSLTLEWYFEKFDTLPDDIKGANVYILIPDSAAKVLVIDNPEDYELVASLYPVNFYECNGQIDFERLSTNYDAVLVTIEILDWKPYSVLWFRWAFKDVIYVPYPELTGRL